MKNRTLDEALLLETVIRLETCYATSSKMDLKMLITKDRFCKRICYCDDEWLWLVGNARSCYHYSMVDQANEKGLTKLNGDSKEYGKFYYLPHYYRENETEEDIKELINDEFSAATSILVFDEFILGLEDDATIGLDKLVDALVGQTEPFLKIKL